jgi:hypothetical protein
MRPSNVAYTFPVEGNSTESVTFVGFDKIWTTGTPLNNVIGSGSYGNITDVYDAPISGVNVATGVINGTVFRRQHFSTGIPGSATYIPTEVLAATAGLPKKIQNITASVDIGRENIFELGSFRPYIKYANFPVTTTAEFEVIATSGDMVSASGDGFNLTDQQIYLNFDNSVKTLSIDLGKKNKLTSVNYTGGDTGGGNATITYSYQGFNYFIVMTGNSALNTSGA